VLVCQSATSDELIGSHGSWDFGVFVASSSELMPRTERRRVRVLVEPGGTELAVAEVADTTLARLVGLLGHASLEPGEGMVIEPCSSIHTCFMRFPIDVLFVDRDGLVVRAVRAIEPFRAALGGPDARRAIELPAGTLARMSVESGVRVRLVPP